MKTIAEHAADLDAGRTTSRALTDAALARIADGDGEGRFAFTRVYTDEALAAADASDRLRAAGIVPSPLAGLPVSIKDLCDVAGETTLAGSVVRQGAAPAAADAPVVARLRAAGAVIVGRTNMTEFAMGTPGTNAHYGTPANPWDRATRRIPGGSSSGAAVSVTDGMAAAALGTDTAGSVRVPAALCGITGFKPTARRVPIAGLYPLSQNLDSAGPLAPSLSCCCVVDAVFAGEAPLVPAPFPLAGLRVGLLKTVVLDDMDTATANALERALGRLSAAGAQVRDLEIPAVARLPAINRRGGFSTADAYWLHRDMLASDAARYDPNVANRILMGKETTAADYIDLQRARAEIRMEADAATARFDVVVMPTVPVVACAIADVEDGDGWLSMGRLLLRNSLVGNFLDRCAVSIPCHDAGAAPVGLMLMGETMGDGRLKEIGLGVEAVLSAGRG